MGNEYTLHGEMRDVRGKKVARLRKAGQVPGVVYGKTMSPVLVQVSTIDAEKVIRLAGLHSPVELVIGGSPYLTMIKDVDRDQLHGSVRHVAFHAVSQHDAVTAEVSIVLTHSGESDAEKAGLLVIQSLELLEVRGLPKQLPSKLEVSVLSLKATGDHVTVADIVLPKGVEVIENQTHQRERVVATVHDPEAVAQANNGPSESASVEDIPSDRGGDTPQSTQAPESRPGGKGQREPKQSELDANKV